jgi:hypothetical protein
MRLKPDIFFFLLHELKLVAINKNQAELLFMFFGFSLHMRKLLVDLHIHCHDVYVVDK